ncbi:hypothetical protein BDP27DRAFT_1328677 [Rhodocollybia butyracea]|uniref:Uncharacterized protein n=1 Tax=Rhodocollybia butyracea TaxID=206335 RepID=A0A9P5U604_9AGAR|nr:hypothetical protein BDP27DRAFT_1328677 [Rhodocollybia butyracea]
MRSTTVLQLVRSEFPQILTLTIHCEGLRYIFPFKDFIASLSSLPCLRVISLIQTFGCVDFEEELVQQPLNFDPVQIRAAIIQYACRLACEISSIEAFFISERNDESCRIPIWYIKGWVRGDELRQNGVKSEIYRVPVAHGGRSSCATYYV